MVSLIFLSPVLWHVIMSCEVSHQIRGVQDLPQTVIQGILLPTGCFTCRNTFWDLQNSAPAFNLRGIKTAHTLWRRDGVCGSFQLGFWFASKLTQPLKIKESLHKIICFRTPFGKTQIIFFFFFLYFLNPFLTLAPVFNFCLMLSPSVHSLLFSSSSDQNTTGQYLHTCNNTARQKKGCFPLNALCALWELVFSSSTHRVLSREHQVHLGAFAERLEVTLHQRCFYRHEVATIRFLTESIIAVF